MSDHEEKEPRSVSRRPGEGTVDQLPSGRWRVRLIDPMGARRSTTFPTAQEAELFRAGTLALWAEQPEAFERTLTTWGKEWLDARELSGEHRAVATERNVWNTHVVGSELAKLPLVEITRAHVKAWLLAMKTKKAMRPVRNGLAVSTERALSRSTIHKALCLVRGALKGAVDAELLDADPSHGVTLGKRAATTEEPWTWLSPEEIERVRTSSAIPEPARVVYLVAIYTGLRAGELWGLHWRDVRLDGPMPEIVVRYSHTGPTKSGKVRHVPVFERAREALLAWQKVCPKNATGLVFANREGGRRRRSDDAGWSDQAIGRRDRAQGGPTHRPGHKTLAGIERDVRFHDLRHTCASHLVMGTWGRAWRLEEVKLFLGHSDIAVTQRYAHLSPEHLHRAASETARSGHGAGHVEEGAVVIPLDSQRARRDLNPQPSDPKGKTNPPQNHDLPFPYDLRVTRFAAMAILQAAATADEVPDALIDDLIDAVLGTPVVRLALGAREVTPQRLHLALRLAAAVLTACETYEAVTGESLR